MGQKLARVKDLFGMTEFQEGRYACREKEI